MLRFLIFIYISVFYFYINIFLVLHYFLGVVHHSFLMFLMCLSSRIFLFRNSSCIESSEFYVFVDYMSVCKCMMIPTARRRIFKTVIFENSLCYLNRVLLLRM